MQAGVSFYCNGSRRGTGRSIGCDRRITSRRRRRPDREVALPKTQGLRRVSLSGDSPAAGTTGRLERLPSLSTLNRPPAVDLFCKIREALLPARARFWPEPLSLRSTFVRARDASRR